MYCRINKRWLFSSINDIEMDFLNNIFIQYFNDIF